MRLPSLKNPVMSSWLREQGDRLDPNPFVSGAIEVRKLLDRLPVEKEYLSSLTTGHDGGIYNGPQFRRSYVNDPEYGVPFLGSSDMLQADLSRLPLLLKRDAESARLAYLRLAEGMTLISCSGTVGRTVYARPVMVGMWSSQHIMKVVPDSDRVPPGYLYAFLSSPVGAPLLTGGTYGTIVQHIEPHHIADLPVPRLGERLEARAHELIERAAELRSEFQAELEAATSDFFNSAGLPELLNLRWHDQPRDLGFHISRVTPATLRALNFAPRATWVMDKLRSVPHTTLGEICDGGQLSRGGRFRRIDSDPEHGAQLIGQRQGFWLRPEGRWVALRYTPSYVFAKDETVMVASQGTLGENEVYCQAILVTGRWLAYAYTEHFLRVVSGRPEYPGAFLFAFLRSPAAFRCFRSMSVGSKQQDLHPALLADFPVPVCDPAARERIAERVRAAHRIRDEADALEDQAWELVENAVKEAL